MPRLLLVSTYDLGHQPFGLASPAAWLRRAGVEVRVLDLSRQPLTSADVAWAELAAFHLPMHTATRLALPLIERIRREYPAIRIAAYGLYAPPNQETLLASGVDRVIGPESEQELVSVALDPEYVPARGTLPRLALIQPDRAGLPDPARYAALHLPDGTTRTAGYTETTRGCKHQCRHCPIVPVYDGRFRVVPLDVVLADIRAQVDAGAQHVTFGDPDFLNGPAHARRIVERMHDEWPSITYDVVIKIEHILRHARLLDTLRETGCLFITSALESFDDEVLARLAKGHTRRDIVRAVAVLRSAGVPLVPTFVAFTPWTTATSYLEMLDTIEELDLVEHVAPIQLGIRLLLPNGSRLLDLPEVALLARPFDSAALAHPWVHPDLRMDTLHRDVMTVVGRAMDAPRAAVFEQVRALACDAAGVSPLVSDAPRPGRATVPYLNEPWYC